MSKAKITDVIIVAIISGVVALLTSFMGISGTLIGAVVTSFIGEFLKKYFKDPLISEMKDENIKIPKRNKKINKRYDNKKFSKYEDNSFITTKVLFLFPLVIILIIELIHFLGVMNIIPYNIFLNLEHLTNWKLFRTIGIALILMGFYPIISDKINSTHGIILIIVGFIELIIGFADTNIQALALFSLFESIKEYVNIGIIISILYTILTIPDDLEKNNKHNKKSHRFNNYQETESIDEYKEDNYHYFDD